METGMWASVELLLNIWKILSWDPVQNIHQPSTDSLYKYIWFVIDFM